MIISNVKVYTTDFKFEDGSVETKDDKIVKVYKKGEALPTSDKVIDGKGQYLLPGFVDIHFHGIGGDDFSDGDSEADRRIARAEAKLGITTICPATMTVSEDDLIKALEAGAAASKAADPDKEARILGINMEGPFISVEKKGAQNPDYIKKCDLALLDKFIEASEGLVRIVGLAPECNDFEEYVKEASRKLTVSLCHTNAPYEVAAKALKAGASHAIHLYNGMSDFNHRDPGVVGAVFEDDKATAEVISDGIHVHPVAIKFAYEKIGKERLVLISDSLRATNMPDGEYELGGLEIVVKGKEARLKKEGNIAGSVTPLPKCMQFAVKTAGIALEDAVRCATYNPAKVIKAEKKVGSIKPGLFADFVFLDKDLNVTKVILNGKEL